MSGGCIECVECVEPSRVLPGPPGPWENTCRSLNRLCRRVKRPHAVRLHLHVPLPPHFLDLLLQCCDDGRTKDPEDLGDL